MASKSATIPATPAPRITYRPRTGGAHIIGADVGDAAAPQAPQPQPQEEKTS